MGLGQGSRGAPPLWLQISSIIVNPMRKAGCGARLRDPIDTNIVTYTIGALVVDDAELYIWDNNYKPGQLWVRCQHECDYWNQLRDATGGALKPEKFCMQLIMNVSIESGNIAMITKPKSW